MLRVFNMAIDEGGIKLLDLVPKKPVFKNLVFLREQVTFVDLALFDDGTALSDFPSLAGDLLLGTYPLAEFIILPQVERPRRV